MSATVVPTAPFVPRLRTIRGYAVTLVARLLRFAIVVPLTALTLHALQPATPWWSWCGVSALSLLVVWCIDGCVAFLRWRKRRSLNTS